MLAETDQADIRTQAFLRERLAEGARALGAVAAPVALAGDEREVLRGRGRGDVAHGRRIPPRCRRPRADPGVGRREDDREPARLEVIDVAAWAADRSSGTTMSPSASHGPTGTKSVSRAARATPFATAPSACVLTPAASRRWQPWSARSAVMPAIRACACRSMVCPGRPANSETNPSVVLAFITVEPFPPVRNRSRTSLSRARPPPRPVLGLGRREPRARRCVRAAIRPGWADLEDTTRGEREATRMEEQS